MDRRAWLLFAAVSILWGVPYFFIKVALHDLTPPVVAFARVGIGALFLLPVAGAGGKIALLRSRPRELLVLAVVEVVLPFVLIPGGERHISSSLTGILIATEPLFVALLAGRIAASERVGGTRLVGMVIGLVGVGVLLGLGGGTQSSLAGASLILAATLCYAAGALLVKRWFADVDSAMVVGVTLSIATIVLAAPALLSAPHHALSLATLAVLPILGIACTSLGFLAFFALIARVGPGRAAVITYVSPTVAVLLGVVGGGESFTPAIGAGLLLILVGSWLSTSMGVTLRRRAFGRRYVE